MNQPTSKVAQQKAAPITFISFPLIVERVPPPCGVDGNDLVTTFDLELGNHTDTNYGANW